MARPKKKTVDYFPHSCENGKTLFILEQHFGNDGYAFWFKLLELLGKTPNHYLDLQNSADFEFLQAKTKLSDVDTCRILDLLCRLGAIDAKLWQNRIVWCQNFVDNIGEVYLNRRVAVPSKPILDVVSTSHNRVSTIETPVSTTQNPQSKVKETKVKETKLNGNFSAEEKISLKKNSPQINLSEQKIKKAGKLENENVNEKDEQ